MANGNVFTEKAKNPLIPEKTPEQKCIDKGGEWDGEKCIMPQSVRKNIPNPKNLPVVTGTEGTQRLAEQGQAANEERARIQEGKIAFGDTEAAAQREEAEALRASQVAQALSDFTPEEIAQAQAGVTDAPANLKQALIAGTLGSAGTIAGATAAGAGGGAGTGAGIGAIIGSAVGPAGTAAGAATGATFGAIAGGAIGFAAAIYGGVKGNIKAQQKGEIQAAQDYLIQGKSAGTKLAMMARQYPELAPQFAQDYREVELMMIRKRAQIKAETSGNLNSWMEDGRAELSDFDAYLETTSPVIKERIRLAASGGLPPMSDAEFQLALALAE